LEKLRGNNWATAVEIGQITIMLEISQCFSASDMLAFIAAGKTNITKYEIMLFLIRKARIRVNVRFWAPPLIEIFSLKHTS